MRRRGAGTERDAADGTGFGIGALRNRLRTAGNRTAAHGNGIRLHRLRIHADGHPAGRSAGHAGAVSHADTVVAIDYRVETDGNGILPDCQRIAAGRIGMENCEATTGAVIDASAPLSCRTVTASCNCVPSATLMICR